MIYVDVEEWMAKDGWDEDGETIVFMGKLDAGVGGVVFADDGESFEMDKMPKGLWNLFRKMLKMAPHTGYGQGKMLVERDVNSDYQISFYCL